MPIMLLAVGVFANPLTALAGPTVKLPLVKGFVDGHEVYYIQTEASDAGVAAGQQVHFVSKLANVLKAPLVSFDDIYVATNSTLSQPNILPSIPTPVGPTNTSAAYSPLWQVSAYTWVTGKTQRILKSEAEVLAAQTAGDITIAKPGIIVNCPVIFSSSLNASFDNFVTLPLTSGFFNGQEVLYISTEASDAGAAAGNNNSTFVPALANALGAPISAVDDIYVSPNSKVSQVNILPSVPTPFGPSNADPAYSPLWQVSVYNWVAGKTERVLKSEAEVLAAVAAGEITITKTNIIVNCQVIHLTGGGTLPNAVVTTSTTAAPASSGSGGCTIQPNAKFDPLLLLMVAFSGLYFVRRRVAK